VGVAALAAAAGTSIAASAGVAHAATGTFVIKSGKQLVISATGSKANDIFVRPSPDLTPTILVRDLGDVLLAGAGCHSAGTEVACSAVGISDIVVFAGDGDDRIILDVTASANTVNAGSGADNVRLLKSTGNDEINGGDGDDVLHGSSSGFNRLFGGNGDDVIIGGNASDVIQGGAGDDTIKALGGNDELRGDADFDTLDGGGGNDDLCVGEVKTNCEA